MKLDSKKKTEGFSKFSQCYDLSTGVLSEINSFKALFLAKKNTQKKLNIYMTYANQFLHGQCTGMHTIQRYLSRLHNVTSACSAFCWQELLSSPVDTYLLKSNIRPTTIINGRFTHCQ